jgi:orotidine-5'-phosphate decarboxylase
MLRAFVAGARDGARDAGAPAPITLAVTVLTSEPDASAFDERLRVAVASGCGGVVCSALEAATARTAGMRSMVPGIRLAGASADDQARVATPGTAIADGAEWLVLSRTVHGAADPEAAAALAAEEVEQALSGG